MTRFAIGFAAGTALFFAGRVADVAMAESIVGEFISGGLHLYGGIVTAWGFYIVDWRRA